MICRCVRDEVRLEVRGRTEQTLVVGLMSSHWPEMLFGIAGASCLCFNLSNLFNWRFATPGCYRSRTLICDCSSVLAWSNEEECKSRNWKRHRQPKNAEAVRLYSSFGRIVGHVPYIALCSHFDPLLGPSVIDYREVDNTIRF